MLRSFKSRKAQRGFVTVSLLCLSVFSRAEAVDYGRDLGGAVEVEILDESVHNSRRLNDLHGQEIVNYEVEIFGTTYTLDLKLSKKYEEKGVQLHERKLNEMQRTHKKLSCIYRGRVSGKPQSTAVVSFCDGKLFGSIKLEGEAFNLMPLRENRKLTGVYRHLDSSHSHGFCGVEDSTDDRRLRGVDDGHSHALNSLKTTTDKRKLASDSTVEVVVAVDVTTSEIFGEFTFNVVLILFELVVEFYDVWPSDEDVELALVGIIVLREEPWEYSTSCTAATCKFSHQAGGDPVCCVLENSGGGVQVDSTLGLLQRFREFSVIADSDYLDADQTQLTFDLAHLISGKDFFRSSDGAEGVVGLAGTGGLCGTNFYGTTQFTDSDMSFVAVIMAHEIGHNLGFPHTSSCPSVTGGPYIMDATLTPTLPTEWSSCATDAWDDHRPSCSSTELDVSTNNINTAGYCGNGVVDDGEECDCGLADCGEWDPCCDGDTCLYIGGADCAANDGCCDLTTCKAADNNTVCRAQEHPFCDVEEVCNGVDISCPSDEWAQPSGASCTPLEGSSVSGTADPIPGACFKGKCVSAHDACVGLSDPCDIESFTCAAISCEIGCDGSILSTPEMPDGAPCPDDNSKGCFQGTCIEYDDIPLEENCSNFELNAGETDIDCGGPDCPGCVSGLLCITDDDCLGKRTCELTDDNSTRCVDFEDGDEADPVLDLLQQILDWILENPYIAGGIGAGVLALCCFLSFCSSSSRKGKGKYDVRVVRRQPRLG